MLRPGYRCLQLRSKLGTRIELCRVLLHISVGDRPSPWVSGMPYGRHSARRAALTEAEAAKIDPAQLRSGGAKTSSSPSLIGNCASSGGSGGPALEPLEA